MNYKHASWGRRVFECHCKKKEHQFIFVYRKGSGFVARGANNFEVTNGLLDNKMTMRDDPSIGSLYNG